MASEKWVSKLVDNIVKSEEDYRSYKGIQLTNGIKILLVSDPLTDKAAASVDVNVGYMLDPVELPGLAHFCEHMLFLGTAKYPEVNEYNKFLSQHGGCSNAFTVEDHTNYYFDVASEYLQEALDRFSQFFLCPLFNESATEKELNAINSEHEKNIQNDVWRLSRLEKAISDPNHDFCKFGTGNSETLQTTPKSKGIDVRDELLKFYGRHYSSNLMTLCVIGKESLDVLMDMVIPLFSDVVNKEIAPPAWDRHPFSPDYLKLQGYVVPVKDLRSLDITFPIPDLKEQYKADPSRYLGHLVGHEGPGSLLSELKSRDWVNRLYGGYKQGAKGFAFFVVNVDLTTEGIDHTDDIITLLFQYLNMLRDVGPQEWVYEECRNLASLSFRFKDWEKPQICAYTLSSCLQMYPFEDVLCGPYLIPEYNPKLIDDLLNYLHPDNIRIGIIGKKFLDKATEIEKWYGTQYTVEPVQSTVLEVWKEAGLYKTLHLPPENEFIPTQFELVPKHTSVLLPALIKNTEMVRLWYKQDDRFNLPKAILNFEIESPLAYVDPHHFNMLHLFTQLFEDAFSEYSYAANIAGLSYKIINTRYGVLVHVRGYNDKQHILLQKIMDKLVTFKVDPRRFEILKENYMRTLKNFETELPHSHATYYSSLLLSERMWSNDELLHFVDEIKASDVQEIIPHLFSSIHIEALMYGNLSKEHALQLMAIVDGSLTKNLGTRPLLQSQLHRDREYQLPDGSSYVFRYVNNIHPCSAVHVYYQCGPQESRDNILLELFCQIISEPCYTKLRTEEQLGYIVASGGKKNHGVHGVVLLVQSDRTPVYVDSRIEAFLECIDEYIQDMCDEEFQQHKCALSTKRLEKPNKLATQALKYWAEIMSYQYNFDRDNIEVAYLKDLTKADVYAFFKNVISVDAPKRKKLSIHIASSSLKECDDEKNQQTESNIDMSEQLEKDGIAPSSPSVKKPIQVQCITEFKNCLALYPTAKPFIPIPPPLLKQPSKSKL